MLSQADQREESRWHRCLTHRPLPAPPPPPSPRSPHRDLIAPIPSLLVALTLTRAESIPSAIAIRSRIAGMCGASTGHLRDHGRIHVPDRKPASCTTASAGASRSRLLAPSQRASSAGKCCPISPARSAEKRVDDRVQKHVRIAVPASPVSPGNSTPPK